MATQLKDKGHPTLHVVRSDKFAKVIETCSTPPKPSAGLMAMVAAGKKVMHKG